MRVKIGKYTTWWGPYQLAEVICFWARDKKDEHGLPDKPDYVHKFGEWLAHGSIEPDQEVGEVLSWGRERHVTLLYKFLSWFNSKKSRTIKVQIDPWDTWSMDHTLAYIVLPMLKQLKETQHGAPHVEDDDVPEHLRSTSAPPKENDWDTDDNHFKRWDYVLGEMIFAFESKLDDSWEEQFHTGTRDIGWKKLDNGNSKMVKGPNDTSHYDKEGHRTYQKRISNGFRLFGKYFENLWD